MEREYIRAFLDRPWRELEDLRREHAAARFREGGYQACIEASRALRERHQRWAKGDDSNRSADLAHHVNLKAQIEKAAGAFCRR